MVCDTQWNPQRETQQERKAAIKKAITALDQALRMRSIKPVVSGQGGVAFAGWTSTARIGISDACAYRILMATGSALAKAAVAQAELVSGRKVTIGDHSHDGGRTWDRNH